MRLALECPANLVDKIQPFSDFAWLSAVEVLRSSEYSGYYKQYRGFKVLDNGVNEEGSPLSLDNLEKAANLVGAHMVVAPDWIGDFSKTLESLQDTLKKFGPERVVPVIQASSFTEAGAFSSHIRNMVANKTSVPFVAVPYRICEESGDTPETLALKRALVVTNMLDGVNVHLLGFLSLGEFYWYGDNKPNVISIDTGIPVLLGLLGQDILDPLQDKKTPTLKKMEKVELTSSSWTAICRNIALFRRYLP